MDSTELQRGLVELVRRIAPDLEPATLDPRAPLREAVDLDSMDFLNLLAAIHERYGVAIPDAEAGRLRTLADLEAYLRPRLASG